MKLKFYLLFLLFISSILSFSQSLSTSKNDIEIYKRYLKHKTDTLPRLSIGFGFGTNSYTGIVGLSFLERINQRFMLQEGIGISSWGYKGSLELIYNLRFSDRAYFGLGYSYCTGQRNIDDKHVEIETIIERTIPDETINVKFGERFRFSKRYNMFFFEIGYAYRLNRQKIKNIYPTLCYYTYQAMEEERPGGIIFDFGFQFSLKKRKI